MCACVCIHTYIYSWLKSSAMPPLTHMWSRKEDMSEGTNRQL